MTRLIPPPPPGAASASVIFGPTELSKRPALALLLANAINTFNMLDQELAFLFGFLIRRDAFPAGTGPDPYGLAAIDALVTIGSKLDLIERVVEMRDSGHHNADWSKIRDRVRTAAKARNKLAHRVWGVCNDYPNELVALPLFGTNELWNEGDFRDALDKVVEAKRAVLEFSLHFR